MKRKSKPQKKKDRITIKATFKARRPGVEILYVEKKNWESIVGSRGDGI